MSSKDTNNLYLPSSSVRMERGLHLVVGSGPSHSFPSHLYCLRPGADTVVMIWSPFTGRLLRSLNGHTKGLSDIAWSFDSVFLASASDDTTIRIWDIDSVCLLRILLEVTIFWWLIDINMYQGH